MENNFYVYVYFRPWNGQPCYVGKGKGSRWLYHAKRGVSHYNANLARVMTKAARLGLEVPIIKVRENLSEADAFETEAALIAAIGRKPDGGPLVNLTDGGEGSSGLVYTDDQLQHMRRSQKTRWENPESHKKLKSYFSEMTPEEKAARAKKISERTREAMKNPAVKQKISDALTGRVHDEERCALTSRTVRAAYEEDPTIGQRAAASRAAKGHQPMLGKHHSEETKAKMRGRHPSQETREKLSAAHVGKKHTPESRAKISAAHQRRREMQNENTV